MGIINKLFFGKKEDKKIGGYIGHFHLEDWWLNELVDDERSTIIEKFQSVGYDKSEMTSGNVYFNGTVSMFLANLTGYFSTKKDINIAIKIAEKAEEMYGNNMSITDRHFYFLHLLKVYYKNRENSVSFEKAIFYCNEQIKISKEAKKAFENEFESSGLPTHTGYEQLAIIEEKRGNIVQALNLSERAMEEGWGNDWDKRIIRLRKKLNLKQN